MIHKKEVPLALFSGAVENVSLGCAGFRAITEIFELTLKIGIRKKAET